jgi:nucleoside-diphosphate-sugar epimerase
MQAPKVFITGATGYLGGTTLDLLSKTFPAAEYSVLVRTKEQADVITWTYPSVTTILGDISSKEIVIAAANAADVVIDIAGDNESGIHNILSGLASKRDKGTLIHVSGITCLLDPASLNLGHAAPRVYNDADDKAEIVSLGSDREHAALDQSIMRAPEEMGVKTVILSSCQIMGNGSGPWKKETFGHGYVKTVLGRGKGFVVEKGENVWSWCSVRDVASAIVFTLGKVISGSSAIEYGQDGYYFVQTGEVCFREQAQAVATKLQQLGKLDTDAIDELTVPQATEIHPYAGLLWGASCRSRAARLRSIGWSPQETDWKALMDETVVAVASV